MCICCDKKINIIPINSDDKNNEEDIVFNKRKRQIHDEHDSEEIIDASSQMWLDGIIGLVSAGYGSNYDGDEFIIAICDECIEKKKMTGNIAYINNYMGYPIKDDEDYKNSRIAWRRYNRIDDLLNGE